MLQIVMEARPFAKPAGLPWPKEHGAYGQIAFPMVAAFAVAGVSAGGLLIAGATVAGFLAHESALIVLGRRGARVKRELRGQAVLWLTCCLLAAAVAGAGALLAMPPQARPWTALPLVPAAVLVVTIVRGTEKTWYGETAAALAFSGAAVPIAIAAGLPAAISITLAIPFALLFVSTTLAVRVVILRVRGGGDVKAMSATRRATLCLSLGSTAVLALLSSAGVVPTSTLAAAAPGLLTALFVSLRPPAPFHLRRLGWALVAISVLTTVIVVSTT
jgi:hypothetical protein